MIAEKPGIFYQNESIALWRGLSFLNIAGTAASVALSGETATITFKNHLISIPAGVLGVGGSVIKVATLGVVADEMTMPYAGRLVAMGVHMSAARTAGSCLVRPVLNGSGGTAELIIDATHTTNWYQVLTTPIDFVAGDTLGVETQTLSFTPTGADATVSLFIEVYQN